MDAVIEKHRRRVAKIEALQTTVVLDLPADFDRQDDRFKAVMLKWAMDVQDGSVPLEPLRYVPGVSLGNYALVCTRLWDADTERVEVWAVAAVPLERRSES